MFKYIFFFLISINFVTANLYINEIMYNPEGSDNNQEYIEIILDDYINLTNYKIQDLKSEDSLEELQHFDNDYALIVEEDFDYNGIDASIYSVGKTIGNNLNNDGDIIVIKDQNDTILEVVSYSDKWGGNNDGNSLCKIPDKTGLWQECSKTPGERNNEEEEGDNEESSYKIIINEFLPNPIGKDDEEFVELYNKDSEDIDLLGFEIKDNSNRKVIITETNTEKGTVIKKNKYLVVYSSSFLNNKGFEEIKLYDKNKLIDKVSYSNSKEGLSWSYIEDEWVITEKSLGKKNKIIEEGKILNSTIEIEKIYDLGNDNKSSWGSSIRVKLNIYKGESTKNVISVYIEKDDKRISKISKLNVFEKFSENEITMPLQLILNCNGKFKDGDYDIVVKGLDAIAKDKLKVEGRSDECNDVVKEVVVEKKIESVKNSENEVSNKISGRLVYENSSNKAGRLGIFFFSALLVVLLITVQNDRRNTD